MAPGIMQEWPGAKYFWGLSFAAARRHFSKMLLVTDKAGKAWLIDQLGLPFDEVRTDLEVTMSRDYPRLAHVWAAGKIATYRAMTEPFCHLDADVFLWKDVPDRLRTAGVFVQSQETLDHLGRRTVNGADYGVLIFKREMPEVPEAIQVALSQDRHVAWNTGIFGGNNLEFIHAYADAALAALSHPANHVEHLHGTLATLMAEQYFLGALAADQNIHVEPLLSEECTEEETAVVGYTHAIADIKRHPAILERVIKRLRKEHPDIYRLVSRNDLH